MPGKSDSRPIRTGPACGSIGEGVVGDDLGHLGGRPDDHTDRLPRVSPELRLERGLGLGLRALALGQDIAARDIGAHVLESGLLAQPPEVAHRQFARAPDIDGA